MTDLQTSVELLVATVELAQTRSVLNAIDVADITSAAAVAGRMIRDRWEYAHYLDRNPCYEPRQVIHPTPRVEPRQVIHPPPVVAQPEILPASPTESDIACKPACGKSESVFQPPWRKVPWNEPMPPRPVVKIVVRPPDVVRTGKLIDFYM